MKIITINLSKRELEAIQVLTDAVFDSRSHFIREALREYLIKEMEYYRELDVDNMKALVRERK